MDTSLTIAGSEVLANDSDVDGDPLTIISMETTTAENGIVTDNGDDTFTYSPPAGYTGVDSWTYQIADGNGGTAGAVISMVIRGTNNNAPLAVNDGLTVNQNETLNFTAADLLENDSDPDGDPLTIVAMDPQTANGITIFSTSDGGFSYTAPADCSGVDNFNYQISDNNGASSTATVTITVVENNPSPETAAILFPQAVQVEAGSYD